jgi:hypothetical protein
LQSVSSSIDPYFNCIYPPFQGALHLSNSEHATLSADKELLENLLQTCEESLDGHIRECEGLRVEVGELREAKDDLNNTCLMSEAREERDTFKDDYLYIYIKL